MKKLIKLINNERKNTTIVAKKALICETGSTDICIYEDNAICTSNSYDYCNKDYAGCFDEGYDYCNTYRDTDLCGHSYDYN